MKQEEDKFTGLPENAFRELKPGEVYNPLMSPSKNYPEVNFWSVAWGIAMAILFSAAAAYLGLKVGQVFEAAIPIAIIADCGRSDLHTSCSLYPSGKISRDDSYFHAGIHQFPAGWCTGNSVPDSFPEIFRK